MSRLSHFWACQNKPFGSLGTELWEPSIYIWVLFSESSIKFLQVSKTFASCKFLFMYSFTHTNIVFLFRHLPTEIGIFINVCYQMKCFSISCEVQTRYSKKLKYSEQYIRDHLSGTKVRIWIYSEYEAIFNFSCIASGQVIPT